MQYGTASDEHPSMASRDGVSTVFSSGLLLDLNLNMSIPDTYRSPPAPLPYDVVLGSPVDLKEAKCKAQLGFLPPSPKKSDLECLNPNPLPVSATTDEEDVCPTCLEGE